MLASGKKAKDITFKQFGKKYLFLLGIGITYSYIESVFFDDYWY